MPRDRLITTRKPTEKPEAPIFAAGLLKLPDLFGPLGQGIRGQVLLGSLMSGLAAYISVRYLTRYFQVRSLRPFGWYCLIAGLLCFGWFLR